MNTKLLFALSCIILLMALLPAYTLPCNADEALITDYNALMSAINDADDGDTIFVGDIDFSPHSPDIANSYMTVGIKKSLNIKSGKQGGAVFANGGFLLSGSKVSGEKIQLVFENIVFDGKADSESISLSDFDYPSNGAYNAPLKAQRAFTFKGNAYLEFKDCVFKNYMHENGSVIEVRYGDYTDNAFLMDKYGDCSGCSLDISFDGCRIENNSSLYNGGAIYIDADNNVKLSAKNCVFVGNKSGDSENARGGGFINANGAVLEFTDCSFESNTANHLYKGATPPEMDMHGGGALLAEGCELTLTNCKLKSNRASMGGALSLTNTRADIDGCLFEENRAHAVAADPSGIIVVGPWSNMGQGGAVYVEGTSGDTVTLINCNIKNNSAETAYGGVYGYYTPNDTTDYGTYYIKMLLCSYEGNKCDIVYDYTDRGLQLWITHAGDMFTNPRLTMLGCYVVDESFEDEFHHNEKPTKENGFNYLAPTADTSVLKTAIPKDAAADIIGTRYDGKLAEVHIGSNYSSELYKAEETKPDESFVSTESSDTPTQPKDRFTKPYQIIIAFFIVLVSIAAIVIIAVQKGKQSKVKAPAPQAQQSQKQIVMTRYQDEDIDRFISLLPEAGTLTVRETEVLREMLKGKKQSEVAYYLGIEVSTVKDFYKKIYTKLDVQNKEALFIKASEILK